jgi:hypothetical protein
LLPEMGPFVQIAKQPFDVFDLGFVGYVAASMRLHKFMNNSRISVSNDSNNFRSQANLSSSK